MLPKDKEEFFKTLNEDNPNPVWSEVLKSLWYDAKGDWESSHNIAQDLHIEMGSWIHAYLHRKEGDEWNAGYWYHQAGRPFPKITLEKEHQEIVEFILRNQ